MRTLNVNLEDRSYPIYIGSDVSLDNKLYSKHIKTKKIALITNEQIADLLNKHIVEETAQRQELADKVAFYEKEFNINPLSWGKRKKK